MLKKISILNQCDLQRFRQIAIINEAPADARQFGVHHELIGWIKDTSSGIFVLLGLSGEEIRYDSTEVRTIRMLTPGVELVHLIDRNLTAFCIPGFSVNVARALSALWMRQQGDQASAFLLLSASPTLQYTRNWAAQLEEDFGMMHYSTLLEAYAVERDFAKAIDIGRHLNKIDFPTFRYTEEAMTLSTQLARQGHFFHSFQLPDSLTWKRQKAAMSRKEQLHFLAERIRLLNCLQWMQPGDVDFSDPQTSISVHALRKDSSSTFFWEKVPLFRVINPYSEILSLKPEPAELELLLPYLEDTSFIPSYSYQRIWLSSRHLYRVNEVIADLLFRITNRRLVEIDSFPHLSQARRKIEVENVRQWIKSQRKTHDRIKLTIIILLCGMTLGAWLLLRPQKS